MEKYENLGLVGEGSYGYVLLKLRLDLPFPLSAPAHPTHFVATVFIETVQLGI